VPASYAFGTSYFLFLKYNVYTVEENIARYVAEIHETEQLLATGEAGFQNLFDAVNANKDSNRYHPRLTRQIVSLTQANYFDPRASQTDKRLIALTFWLICKLRKVPSVLQFLLKGAKGGRSTDYQFLEDGGAYTCVDTSAITATLCRELGIDGTIRNDGIGSVFGFHHFYETAEGRIIDVPFGLLEGGFFFDAANHPKTYKIVFAFFRSTARRIARRAGFRRR